MALRNIVLDGDEVLKKKSRPVEKFDERLATLLDDMAETMILGDGLGLAAPQVGVLRRAFVALDESRLPELPIPEEGEENAEEDLLSYEDMKQAVVEFINPEILDPEGEERGYEGCLSFPGRFGAIARPTKVKVRAQDRFGNAFEFEAQGLMARCVCHETDHLNGVTIDDLAEYFYDPEVPHDLDETIGAGHEEEEEGTAEE